MVDSVATAALLDEFIRRWEASGAAERANYSMFLNELCDLLEVPRPDPAGPDDEKNAYVFERAVPFPNPDGTTTVKRIDLYKRACFVLEAKQGSNKVAEPEAFTLSAPKKMKRHTAVRGTAGWDAAMYEAKRAGYATTAVPMPSPKWRTHSRPWRKRADHLHVSRFELASRCFSATAMDSSGHAYHNSLG